MINKLAWFFKEQKDSGFISGGAAGRGRSAEEDERQRRSSGGSEEVERGREGERGRRSRRKVSRSDHLGSPLLSLSLFPPLSPTVNALQLSL